MHWAAEPAKGRDGFTVLRSASNGSKAPARHPHVSTAPLLRLTYDQPMRQAKQLAVASGPQQIGHSARRERRGSNHLRSSVRLGDGLGGCAALGRPLVGALW